MLERTRKLHAEGTALTIGHLQRNPTSQVFTHLNILHVLLFLFDNSLFQT